MPFKPEPHWSYLPRSIPDLVRKVERKGKPLLYASVVAILGATQIVQTSYGLDQDGNLAVRQQVVSTNGKKHVPYALSTTVFLTATGANSWPVPTDWDNSTGFVSIVGNGGHGGAVRSASPKGTGGGGGAFASNNLSGLTPGGTAAYNIGTVSGDLTWISNTGVAPTSTSEGCLADSGRAGTGSSSSSAVPGGSGGLASNSIGTTKFDGGDGGTVATGVTAATGGGGAAGPNGAGANAATATGTGATSGGKADNGTVNGGTGSASQTVNAFPGASGTEFDATHGCGGGGGGDYKTTGASKNPLGGSGGNYGGGGGGGAFSAGSGVAAGGTGAQGIIVITYTPAANWLPQFNQKRTFLRRRG